MRRLIVWGGLGLIVLLALASLDDPAPRRDVASIPSRLESGCLPHVELKPVAYVANELGRSESWILANYRINLWSRTSAEGKGVAVGKMVPGSRARILDRGGSDYLVRSPLDGSEGWIGETQVEREALYDAAEGRVCSSSSAAGYELQVIQCPDGTTYVGNRPEEACR